MKRISSHECQLILDNETAQLIDVRESWEVEICAIGGQFIPMHLISSEVSNLDKQKAYIILCKTGRRAEAVANLLEAEYGFEDISILSGGITEWFAVNDPSFEMY